METKGVAGGPRGNCITGEIGGGPPERGPLLLAAPVATFASDLVLVPTTLGPNLHFY